MLPATSPTSVPPARPRAVDDARHRRVCEAVRALVAEHGLHVSMEAVAARAGCAKQTLYARYGSRQGLMAAVARDGMAVARLPEVPTAATLRPALLAFAQDHLEHLARPSTIGGARLLAAQAQQFPHEVGELFAGWAGTLQGQLATWLQQAMRRGLLRHDDPHCAAELLLGTIVGLDFDRQRHRAPHRSKPEDRARWAQFAVDSFLRAFAPPCPLP